MNDKECPRCGAYGFGCYECTPIDDDPPCTGCHDTGFNPNTEKACDCAEGLKLQQAD